MKLDIATQSFLGKHLTYFKKKVESINRLLHQYFVGRCRIQSIGCWLGNSVRGFVYCCLIFECNHKVLLSLHISPFVSHGEMKVAVRVALYASCLDFLLFMHRPHREPAAETADRLWWCDRETLLWSLWPGGFPQNTRSTGSVWESLTVNVNKKTKQQKTTHIYELASSHKSKLHCAIILQCMTYHV